LQQPKVREVLKEVAIENDAGAKQSILADVLFGSDKPLDPRVEELSYSERADLAFDQRIVPATATNIASLFYGPKVANVLSSVTPDRFEIPAKVIASAGIGRSTFPPAKYLADWYHGEILEQPIVDPAVGIFTDENAVDMFYAVPSSAIGMGAQALTTTALTALGVSNPIGLTLAGLGAGSYFASKGWVTLEELLVPGTLDYLVDSIVNSIDVERLTGVPESDSPAEFIPPTIEELEALWDRVADQVPEAEVQALRSSLGTMAPDSWTIGDIARYEVTGEMPEADPELADFFERNGLSLPEPVVDSQGDSVDMAVQTSPRPPAPIFRSVRADIETVTFVDYVTPEPEDVVSVTNRFMADDGNDDPHPQCLVPYWLIPYVNELKALGVKNFCALRDLTPKDIEELISELATMPDEPVPSGEEAFDYPVFESSRVDKTLEEEDDEEDVTNAFLLV
jgi:hypothetical protein